MKKKKIISLLLVAMLCTAVAVGCGNATNIDFSSEQTLKEFKNEIFRYSLGTQEKYTTEDFTSNLSNLLSRLDDDEKEEYLTYYVQGLYKSASELEQKLGVLGYEMEDVISENGIKDLTYKSFAKLSDEHATVKGFVKEVETKGFFLGRNVSTNLLSINVELDKILDSYGEFLGDSLRQYYEFNNYENKTSFMKDNTIDIDEVVNRIIKIEDGIETDKKSNYKHIDKWINSYNYYYDMLCGVSHEYFLSSGYFKEDVVSKFKELAEKYKDKEVGQNLTKMVATLEQNNNKNNGEIAKMGKEFKDNKLTANDSEIQKALDSLNKDLSIDDLADKLGMSVDELNQSLNATPEESNQPAPEENNQPTPEGEGNKTE